jgi:hypothetical protein
MKFRTALLVLLSALTLGVIGCKARSGEPDSPRQAAAEEPQPASNPDKVEPPADDQTANPTQHSSKLSIKPLAVLSSQGATRVEMKNVNFHSQDDFVLRIRGLRGVFLRKNPSTPVVFDDKRSFVMRIDSGTVGIRLDNLAELLNNYVFAYPKAPLKKIEISAKGNQLKLSAQMHKVIDVPVRIVGTLSPTPEGKIRLHPESMKAAGLPVKGFMHLFGLDLSEVMKANEERGVRIDGDDIIMDQERMLPPPAIRGRITAIRVENDEVVQDFGGGSKLSAAKGSNYMSYRGGTLRFGKLTMNNADLKIVDTDPGNPFDFSMDHYNTQLVAGTSKNTPSFGLVVYMPDYYKVSGGAQSKVSFPSTNGVANAKQQTSSPLREFTFETKELFDQTEKSKLSKEKELKEAGSFLKKNLDAFVVVKVQSGSERTKDQNVRLSESRAIAIQEHLKRKFKLNETTFKTVAKSASPTTPKGDTVMISVYSGNLENRAINAINR